MNKDQTERPNDVSDEPERPSQVVARVPCVVCGRSGSRRRRRRCCLACVRKFADCGVALPAVAVAAPPGPPPGRRPPPADPLLWLIDRMTPAQRDKARLYLGELAAQEARP